MAATTIILVLREIVKPGGFSIVLHEVGEKLYQLGN